MLSGSRAVISGQIYWPQKKTIYSAAYQLAPYPHRQDCREFPNIGFEPKPAPAARHSDAPEIESKIAKLDHYDPISPSQGHGYAWQYQAGFPDQRPAPIDAARCAVLT